MPGANNLAAIKSALESAGVIFVDENGEGPGVRLRKRKTGVDHPEPAGPATDAFKDGGCHRQGRQEKKTAIRIDIAAGNFFF